MKRFIIASMQLLAVLVLCGVALHLANSGLDFKWILIGVLTLLIFGRICYNTKNLWSERYWATVAGVFMLHWALVIVFQRNYPMLPVLSYIGIGVVEGVLLHALLDLTFNQPYIGRRKR